jgi:hypothetical protein
MSFRNAFQFKNATSLTVFQKVTLEKNSKKYITLEISILGLSALSHVKQV